MILLEKNINKSEFVIKKKLLRSIIFITYDDITFYIGTNFIKEKEFIFKNKP